MPVNPKRAFIVYINSIFGKLVNNLFPVAQRIKKFTPTYGLYPFKYKLGIYANTACIQYNREAVTDGRRITYR